MNGACPPYAHNVSYTQLLRSRGTMLMKKCLSWRPGVDTGHRCCACVMRYLIAM